MSDPARARTTSALAFVRDIAALAGGGVTAQAISLLATVVLSRLYSPSDLGVAYVFLAWVSVLAPVGALRFDKAIVLPPSADEARNLALLSLALGTASAVAVGVVCLVVSLLPIRSETLDALGGWLYLMPVSIWLSLAVHVVAEICTRDAAFGRLARARMLGALAMASARIGAALAFGSSAAAFLIGTALGDLAQLGWLGMRGAFGPRAGSLRATARAFAEFPVYAVLTTLLNRATHELPVFVLAQLFPKDVVGLFGFTQRTLRGPLDTVGTALAGVGVQRAAVLWNSGERLAPYFTRVTLGLLALALPPLLLIAWRGEPIFAFVFGEEWRAAGGYAAALVPAMLSSLLVSPTNAVFYATRRLSGWLALQIATTLGRVAAFAAGAFWAWDALTLVRVYAWTCFTFDAVAIAAAFALSLSVASDRAAEGT